ncbi:ABC transporter [Vibrio ishigakensis]|uniref:ABC transporter n=1 Tax=Vibrio ishigakensis TaxID=1481914 RepID=A0A0B8PFK9_9VIBR|nr:ABC transporter [Vibrio ishigakensis]
MTVREFIADNRKVEDEEILQALFSMGGEYWFNSLEQGLDTQLNDLESLSHPLSSFEANVLIRAKLFCHRCPLVILDNPVVSNREKQIFLNWIEKTRGDSTIVFTSYDPEIIKVADQIVVLDQGSVSYAGPIPETETETETVEVEA